MNQAKVDWEYRHAVVGAWLNFRHRHDLPALDAAPLAPMSSRHLQDLERMKTHLSDDYLLRLLSVMDEEAILELKARLDEIKGTHQPELVFHPLEHA